jgi:hypothetical protein
VVLSPREGPWRVVLVRICGWHHQTLRDGCSLAICGVRPCDTFHGASCGNRTDDHRSIVSGSISSARRPCIFINPSGICITAGGAVVSARKGIATHKTPSSSAPITASPSPPAKEGNDTLRHAVRGLHAPRATQTFVPAPNSTSTVAPWAAPPSAATFPHHLPRLRRTEPRLGLRWRRTRHRRQRRHQQSLHQCTSPAPSIPLLQSTIRAAGPRIPEVEGATARADHLLQATAVVLAATTSLEAPAAQPRVLAPGNFLYLIYHDFRKTNG